MFVAEAQICKTVQVSTGNGHGILYVGSSPGLVAHTVLVLVGDTLVEEGVEKSFHSGESVVLFPSIFGFIASNLLALAGRRKIDFLLQRGWEICFVL